MKLFNDETGRYIAAPKKGRVDMPYIGVSPTDDPESPFFVTLYNERMEPHAYTWGIKLFKLTGVIVVETTNHVYVGKPSP